MPFKNKKRSRRFKLFDDLEWSDTEYRRRNIAKGLMSDTDTPSLISGPDEEIQYPDEGGPPNNDDPPNDEDPPGNEDPPGDEDPPGEPQAPPDPLPTPVVMPISATGYTPMLFSGHNKADTTVWTATDSLGTKFRPTGTVVPFYIPFFKGPNSRETHPINIQISSNESVGTVSYDNTFIPIQQGTGIAYSFNVPVEQELQVRRFNLTIGSPTQSIVIVRYYKYIPSNLTLQFYDSGHLQHLINNYTGNGWTPNASTVITIPASPSRFVGFNQNARIFKLFVLRNGEKTLVEPQPAYQVPVPAWTTIGFDLTNYPNDTQFAVELTSKSTATISAIGLAYRNA